MGSLYDCLIGIHRGLASDTILDKYNEVRREIYKTIIDPSSRENFERLRVEDAESAGKNDPFFALCTQAHTDLTVARELLTVSPVDHKQKPG